MRHSAHITRSKRWARLRWDILRRDGFQCVECGARGRLEVDHRHPVRTHPERAWDPANLQALCVPCHSRKTCLEQGRSLPNPQRLAWTRLLREELDDADFCEDPAPTV
ncbi:HNH endonuclease [Acuticoccus mangrovi]|uniref:Putative HNH nuclease YajD n=1 Tax=Acuticoccus mangrovi TaxID=2796142 RepID=A0A934IPV4_9HYPH|nr:HNH endonuclease [Acuticoccus mangrovi]